MNITIICEVLGEPNNGTSIAAYNLINSLKEKGHNVKVVCPDEDKRGIEGFYILKKANYGSLINKILDKNNVILSKFSEDIISDACKDADLVHILVPLFIAKKTSKYVKDVLNLPLTAGFHAQAENFTSHIDLIYSHIANHFVYKWYNRNLFCRVDAIHYPTKFIQDIFEKEMNRKTNGYVISNGVNKTVKKMEIEKEEQYKDKFSILFTGRLSKEKCHMVLLKAINKSKYKDKIQLFFAGKGPLENKIKKYSQKHLTNQPVINFYTREELVKVINQMDLYVHPSYAEIEAISCIEAITCGVVPIIANSSKSATKGFAPDERCLFKTNSSKDLAEKIDYMIEHPEVRAELSKKCLQSSLAFDQDECMDKMEEMMIETIERCKAKNNEK